MNKVKLRQSDITAYYANAQPQIVMILNKVHPLLSPLTSFDAEQSRTVRLISYMTQVNLYLTLLAVFFGTSYRNADTARKDVFLDSTDITMIKLTTICGSFALLPSVSTLLTHLVKGKLIFAEKVTKQKANCAFRFVYFACYSASIVALVYQTFVVCLECPTAN